MPPTLPGFYWNGIPEIINHNNYYCVKKMAGGKDAPIVVISNAGGLKNPDPAKFTWYLTRQRPGLFLYITKYHSFILCLLPI